MIAYIRLLFVLLVVLIFTSSCKEKKISDETNNVNDFVNMELLDKQIKIPLTYKSNVQINKKRIFKNSEVKFEFKFGSLEDTILAVPIMLKTDRNENIYILDQSACKVIKFDRYGKFITSFGNKGKGPGEMVKPFRFDIGPKNQIVVSDPVLHKCIIFVDGKKNDLPLKYSPIGVCHFLNNTIGILQLNNLMQFSQILKYDYYGNLLKEYDRIINVSNLKDIPPLLSALTGDLIIDKNNELRYITRYLGNIIFYNEKGKFEFSIKTIDNIKTVPNIGVKKLPNGGVYSSSKFPKEQLSSINCGLFNDEIWIASYQGKKKFGVKVFDFYSTKGGKYLYSIRTDKIDSFTWIYLSEQRIYTIRPDGSISVFSLKIL